MYIQMSAKYIFVHFFLSLLYLQVCVTDETDDHHDIIR